MSGSVVVERLLTRTPAVSPNISVPFGTRVPAASQTFYVPFGTRVHTRSKPKILCCVWDPCTCSKSMFLFRLGPLYLQQAKHLCSVWDPRTCSKPNIYVAFGTRVRAASQCFCSVWDPCTCSKPNIYVPFGTRIQAAAAAVCTVVMRGEGQAGALRLSRVFSLKCSGDAYTGLPCAYMNTYKNNRKMGAAVESRRVACALLPVSGRPALSIACDLS
ncbi:unnamed protein product [Pylaiella littoralis]